MENGKTNEPGTTSATTPRSVPTYGQTYDQTAQNYGQKISDAANQAKEYVTDKVAVVGDKIKELQNMDVKELANNATDYARKNPGQAILISAGVGLLLGLLIRGRR